MSIRATVMSHIHDVASENGIALPEVTEAMTFAASGLDSLAIAILAVRLEEALGVDPFASADDFPTIVTVGDFVRLYERTTASRGLDSQRP